MPRQRHQNTKYLCDVGLQPHTSLGAARKDGGDFIPAIADGATGMLGRATQRSKKVYVYNLPLWKRSSEVPDTVLLPSLVNTARNKNNRRMRISSGEAGV